MIRFFAKGRCAHCVTDDKLTKGSVGIEVRFYLEDWDAAPNRVAVFKAGSVKVDVALLSDSCTVPPEVLANPGDMLVIGVYGTDNGGDIVIPTVYAEAGRVRLGTAPSGISPTPTTQPLIDQLVASAEEAERIAQSVRDDADNGVFDGEDGASAYEIAVEHGYTGTEAQWLESLEGNDGASAYEIAVEHGYTGTEEQWLESLHGQDATVDATLSNEGEAADAKATGAGISAARHEGDYALRFAETLNNGNGIPLDAEWLSGDIGGSRPYRAHSKRATNTEQKVLQAAAGYRFYLRIYSNGSYSDSSWYGPGYSSRKTYTLPKGADYIVVVSTNPEDTSVTADPDTYGSKVTIRNNIGSGGGSITVDSALSDSSENPVQNKVITTALNYASQQLTNLGLALDDKVDKVSGKSLSSNDFTDSDKDKLDGAASETWVQQQGYITGADLALYRTEAQQDTIDDAQDAAISAKYTKPSGGIPASDLASAVQTSLGKADTALQTAPVSSVNGQTGAVSLSIPSTASDVGAVASNQGVSNANKVLTVNSSGAVVPEDDRFVVTMTPTSPDYSGTIDRTPADLAAAYEAGKRIIAYAPAFNFRCELSLATIMPGGVYTFDFIALGELNGQDIMLRLLTKYTDSTYTVKIYPLATGQWTGGSY